MAKKSTGSVFVISGKWYGKITLPDGTRKGVTLGPVSEMSRTMAEARVGYFAERIWTSPKAQQQVAERVVERIKQAAPEAKKQDPKTLTYQAWCEPWLIHRARKNSSVADDRGRLRNHVFPLIGSKLIASIDRDELETVVHALDRSVEENKMSSKTALNTWGLITKSFDDACRSKVRELRVRTDNPARDVHGPDRGVKKSKVYIYPSEFLALMQSDKVRLFWRHLYAVAVYTSLRAGEMEALTWYDVDLEHQVLSITKAIDRKTGKVKSTKTGETRRIALEPNLIPLLKFLKSRRAGDRCLRMPPDEDRAEYLRRDLKNAGVRRHDLFADTTEQKQMTFHDLRATGITWMAIRGDDPLQIKYQAGHATFTTTEGYIREGRAVRVGFGAVFPQLPEILYSETNYLQTPNRLRIV